MSVDPTALARHGLAKRIQRFLDDLAGAGRELTPHQIVHTAAALRLLELGIYPEGEDALAKAMHERPPPAIDGARLHSVDVRMVTTAEFKKQLALLMVKEG